MAGKVRSPNYPGIGLEEAIQRARELYNKERTAPVDPETAVMAWGYKGLNGASARTLGAVRQYGLLEDGPKGVRVSPRALALLLEPQNSDDYLSAVMDAARGPAVFAEILDEYPDGLPSEQGLISYLVRQKGFSEDGARKLNSVLRATMALASEHRDRHIPEEPTASQTAAQSEQPRAVHASSPGLSGQTPGRTASPGANVMNFSHALVTRGGTATLSIASERLTQDDLDDLFDWLKMLNGSLRRRLRSGELPSQNEGEVTDGEEE
jgi:hypothetical protein